VIAPFGKKQLDGRLTRLSHTAPLAELVEADEVTLQLNNQKNGVRESTLHHEKVPGNLSPVCAVARHLVPALPLRTSIV
jgi:hypothetical protein